VAKTNLFEYIEGQHNAPRGKSHRGGGIEIDAAEYVGIDGAKMTAYQNYLGGGMTGSVQGSVNFETKDKRKQARAEKLAEALKRYYYNVTNDIVEDYDEWAASASFEAQQSRPASAY
jgi:surface antigen